MGKGGLTPYLNEVRQQQGQAAATAMYPEAKTPEDTADWRTIQDALTRIFDRNYALRVVDPRIPVPHQAPVEPPLPPEAGLDSGLGYQTIPSPITELGVPAR